MNTASLLHPPALFVELGADRLQIRRGADAMELPLERGPEGRVTAAGKEKAVAALREFIKVKSWQSRPKAWCVLGARGVSLRRLSLPGGAPAEFQQRLLLQIEAEYPLPPEDLAWGWQPVAQQGQGNGASGRQDVLVAALKKELLADYQEILRASGTDPVFTLASVARWHVAGRPTDAFAMVDVGPAQSELTVFENALPTVSRLIACGQDTARPSQVALDALAHYIQAGFEGKRLYVSGAGVSREFAEQLERSLGNGCRCERVDSPPAAGGSLAIYGLEQMVAQNGDSHLWIRMEPSASGPAAWASVDWKTWGGRVAALALAALLLPYAEAWLLKWHLERKVAAFKTEAARLTVIDRELDFLRNLKLSQPPYLDLLSVFSKAVPPGTHFDALSLNSHGEVTLRCAFHDGQQVAAFRDKLIASGFFTNVVVAEQSPTPDRQRVNVRISAQEKSAPLLQVASARLALEEAATGGKAGGAETRSGASPMPAGTPPAPPGTGSK